MDEHIKQALDVVKAQASVRNMTEDEITSMVQSLANRLRSLETGEHSEGASEQQEPPVDPKKAIREKSVICLECGKQFKILSKKHLATHDLTPQQYKDKWGYKRNQSLVAKALSRQRRKKMQEIQIWKKRKNA